MPPWQRLNRWLQEVPVEDPLDRRNAPMLQVVLAVPGVLVPAMLALELAEAPGFGAGQAISLALTAFLWSCFWLLRRGRFRLAASLAVVASLVMMGLNYQSYGLKSQLGLQVTHLLPLLFAGLLLGRRAIWRTLAAIGVILVLGAWVDLAGAGDAVAERREVAANLLSAGLGFMVVAAILDRLVSASRRAIRRSEELDLLCDQLEREIEEKERSQAQLLQSQKIEVLGRIAGGIAHDFNNLLGIILGHAGRAGTARDPRDATRSLEGIRHAARRGALMVRRLLGLGRSTQRQVEVFDAAASIRETLDLLRPLFDARVRIELSLPDQPLPVRLDREEFELALLNIASNARDAMPEGGCFRLSAARRGDTVAIGLADTGTGMTADVVARLFEPFYTTKPENRGTGIGMAVVHRLISEAGGRIEVDSAPGRGTTLTLLLPCPAARTGAKAKAPPHRAVSPPRVLLVDDDGPSRTLLADGLSDSGLDVDDVGTAIDALRQARSGHRYDAIVADYELPDGDGASLLHRLRSLQPDARQVLISGRSDLTELAAPPVAILHKPFAPERLADLLLDDGEALSS
ncbi:hybrid sensor histidine kinase/response regulator [Dokdonella koreensis]|uniref:histidine kinase n=1 Tax=Dokdonella koreensis DS-123 TaxID=1300342 RepID=A0A160DUC1_9GAMM|nr:ATP-binding protein [Dokdonella koreensis]ANB18045.1 PAS/PAC sensor hybrid histidine kinase [Dokdonella koreensis DS-123]